MTEYRYTVLGLMSGTSLDGIDIAICSFRETKETWDYEIHFTKTYSYNELWRNTLRDAYNLNGRQLMELDRAYGDYLAEVINLSVAESNIMPDFIASHGQTIFHSPDRRMTCQIGHGANIAVGARIPVISDFRSADVALGGQGAPLVPVGDKFLFNQFQSCLNLGGFSNISFDINDQRKAFDICPVNMILNELSSQLGLDFDKDGLNGRKGKPNPDLSAQLDNLGYYHDYMPKSLGFEWYERNFRPLIVGSELSVYDQLATVYNHIANQICSVFKKYGIANTLVTGGGAHNSFLIELIRKNSSTQIILPDQRIIDFKEAIIFAFLGLLRFMNRINTLASVTGAERDSIGGAIYMP